MKFKIAVLTILFSAQAHANFWEISDRAMDTTVLLDEAIDLAENVADENNDAAERMKKGNKEIAEARSKVGDVKELGDEASDLLSEDDQDSKDVLSAIKRSNFRIRKVKNIKSLISRMAGTKTDAIVASQLMSVNNTLSDIHREQTEFRMERAQERREKRIARLNDKANDLKFKKWVRGQKRLMSPANAVTYSDSNDLKPKAF